MPFYETEDITVQVGHKYSTCLFHTDKHKKLTIVILVDTVKHSTTVCYNIIYYYSIIFTIFKVGTLNLKLGDILK